MLNQPSLDEIKGRLESERDRINREIEEMQSEEVEVLGTRSAEDVDRASTDAAALEKEAQKANLLKEKADVDLALKKMETGEYGRCEKCGEKIDKARLEVLSTARLCMNCKIICDSCGRELEEAAILGKKVPLICQGCKEEVEPGTYFTSSSIRSR